MPVVFRHRGFRVFFYSNEGDPREPLHVHVQRGEALAKFWLVPEVIAAESHGLNGAELSELIDTIEKNRSLIEGTWHEFFGE
ncbi:MAG: DUF4160 domain-containing protein [Halothiobacillaceae bacterium]|jgi:hypothetical protein|nr:MAG: DUF4160 domain-containing protein [Halothiobacillaceae bacterium]